MHRFSSQTPIRRLRLAAFLFLVAAILIPLSVGWMARGLVQQSQMQVAIGFGLGVLGLLFVMLQTLVAHRVRCSAAIACGSPARYSPRIIFAARIVASRRCLRCAIGVR